MKVLLVGSYPPPHGGVGVHVAQLRHGLEDAGVDCRVLDVQRRASGGDGCLTVRNELDFIRIIARHAARGWVFHVHTNGHNIKSWLVALVGGFGGWCGGGAILTLHSGMVPDYLRHANWIRRSLARQASRFYDHIIAVNGGIRDALMDLSLPADSVEVLPVFLPPAQNDASVPDSIQAWLKRRRLVVSAALSFRAEYEWELLLRAVAQLGGSYPELGCVLIGSGDGFAEAQALVRKLNLDQAVFFTGDVDHALCLKLVSVSDLFLRTARTDGDALSVREALWLHVPVVASDVVARPVGVATFETGNIDDLVRKIKDQFAVANKPESIVTQVPAVLDRLLSVYRRTAAVRKRRRNSRVIPEPVQRGEENRG